jgi:hypothetical protein
MMLDIQFLAWDMHKDVTEIKLIIYQPSRLVCVVVIDISEIVFT